MAAAEAVTSGTGVPVGGEFGSAAVENATLEQAMEAENDFSGPWQKPSVELAEKERRRTMFLRGQGSCCKVSLDKEIHTLGAGVDLYFRLLVYLAVVCTVLTIFSLPTLFLSWSGNRFTADEMDPIGLARWTLGNNGPAPVPPAGNTSVICTNPTCTDTFEVQMLGKNIDSKNVGKLISAFDFLGSVFFMLFIVFWRFRMRAIAQDIDDEVLTAEDYGVFVKGLPKDTTEEEVIEHFSRLYALDKPDFDYKGSCGCIGMGRKPQRPPIKAVAAEGPSTEKLVGPLRNTSNTGDDKYMGKWVAEVALARANGKAIRSFLSKQALLKKIRAASAKVQKCRPHAGPPAYPGHPEKLPKAQAKLDKLASKLDKLGTKLPAASDDVVGAFVTFAYQEQEARCLHDYRHSDSCWRKKFLAPELKFRGQYALHVENSPEPSNVIWENIELPPAERCMRRTFTNLIMIALLIGSLGLLFAAQDSKAKFAAKTPKVSACGTEVPAAAFETYDLPKGLRLRKGNSSQQAACETGKFFFEFFVPGNDTVIPPGPVAGNENCTANCHKLTDPRPCPQLDGRGTYQVQTMVDCFCVQVLREEINKLGVFAGAQNAQTLYGDICTESGKNFILANTLLIVAAMSVVIINAILKVVLKGLAAFERHDTVSGAATSLTIKLLLSQVINTGLIVLIVNAKLPGDERFPIEGVGLFEGKHEGFDALWYASVGVSLIITMIVQIFVPHGAPLAQAFVIGPLKRWMARRSAADQILLNAAYEPPSFRIEERLPFILNTLVITFAYSSGLSILLPIAVVNFIVFYWIDKWALLRFYRAPPRLDEASAELVLHLLPFVTIMHVVMAIYMLGDSDVLKSDIINPSLLPTSGSGVSAEQAYEQFKTDSASWDKIGLFPRIVRVNVFPQFMLLILFIVFYVAVQNAFKLVMGILKVVFNFVTCGKCANAVHKLDEEDARAAFDHSVGFNEEARVFLDVPLPPQHKTKKGAVELSEEERDKIDNEYIETQIDKHINDEEKEHGWEIIKHYDPAKPGRVVRAYKVKRWTDSGKIDGVQHVEGKPKKTWEVIRDTTLHTYDIMANPSYRRAVFALRKATTGGTTPKSGALGGLSEGGPDSPAGRAGRSGPAAEAKAGTDEAV